MSLALAFWVTMLLGLVLGIWSAWPNYKTSGVSLIIFILLLLLGWRVFGAPIHS